MRLVDFGLRAIELELFAYVLTSEILKFLAVREELLLQIAGIVEATGSGFARPEIVEAGSVSAPSQEKQRVLLNRSETYGRGGNTRTRSQDQHLYNCSQPGDARKRQRHRTSVPTPGTAYKGAARDICDHAGLRYIGRQGFYVESGGQGRPCRAFGLPNTAHVSKEGF